MNRLFFIFLIAFLILSVKLNIMYAQPTNLGTPIVVNHTKKEIKSGTQTWDIATDNRGFTYFANNSGLVIFDGYNWENHPIANNTVVRSVAIDTEGRIYVGGQGDFGFFEPNIQGTLTYKSLLKFLKKQVAFEDVWDIVVREEGVFFRTNYHVFRYDYKFEVESAFYAETSLLCMGIFGKKLTIQDGSNVFYEYGSNGFKPRTVNTTFDQGRISSVINYLNDTILLTTINNGIFYESKDGFKPWVTPYDTYLRKNIIYCATYLPDGQIILGTSFDGVIVLDENRRIAHHLNKKVGLQNNTILSAMMSQDGNIWLGLDNGIDLVDMNAPFRYFFPDGDLEGTGYAATLYDGQLYFGTNTGLYTIPWQKHYQPSEKEKAHLVEGTQGQVWSLNHVGNQLLVGHHEGAFHINKKSGKKIADLGGVWKFVPLTEKLMIAGHYQGLAMFELKEDTWRFKYHIKGFQESARIITKDMNNNIWIAHPYRGVYKIGQKEIFKEIIHPVKYSSDNPAGKNFRNVFYNINNDVILDDGNDLYRYIPGNDQTEKYIDLTDYLPGKTAINFLMKDEFKNIWYGTEKETAMLVPEKSFNHSYKKYFINDIVGLLPNTFESIVTLDDQNVIFSTEKGFLFFNPKKYVNDTSSVKILLSTVTLNTPKDSVLFKGYTSKNIDIPEFSLRHTQNNISFYFTVMSSGKKEFISYSYQLRGANKSWSEWSIDPKVTFTSLPPGRYILMMKAKNHAGKESQPYEVRISIGYPWYRTPLAYLFYFSGFVILIFFVLNKQKEKHETEKSLLLESNKKREKEHLIHAEASKEEITRLQNEKLLAELNYKNQELTSFTYHLVNKNELISEITDVVNKLEHKLVDQPEIKKELKQITKLTEQNSDVDTDWQNFVKSFDQVHTNFYKRLNEEFKDLSPNDYKLCTYLRMNLATKEIASLMNISIRSVETNRYRLRKKLGLDSDTNLSQFLMNY